SIRNSNTRENCHHSERIAKYLNIHKPAPKIIIRHWVLTKFQYNNRTLVGAL
ncbi:MAG: hypothetical protein RIQ94_1481, partial [Pseudomonadota bacterium]